MQKCGLKYEGTLRQADWSNKGVVDACMYSLLKSEWDKSNSILDSSLTFGIDVKGVSSYWGA